MGLLDRIVDDVFGEFSDSGRKFFESFHPAADVYIKNNDVIIDVDLPGLEGDDIIVDVYGGQDVCGCWFEWAHLYLKVCRKSTMPEDCETFLAHRPLDIVTRIPLPIRLKKEDKTPVAEKVDYKSGVLTLKVPIPAGRKRMTIGQKPNTKQSN